MYYVEIQKSNPFSEKSFGRVVNCRLSPKPPQGCPKYTFIISLQK